MAMYQQDPIASAQIAALEKSLSDSQQERWKLEKRVSELNSEIEKITGMGPEYVRHRTNDLRRHLEESQRVLRESQEKHRSQLKDIEAKIQRELDRYVAAKNLADAIDSAAKLADLKMNLRDDVLTIIRKSIEEDDPFVFQPNVHGIGVDLRKFPRWAKAKFQWAKAKFRR